MLEERAGYSPLSFSALFGPAGLTCVGRITGSSGRGSNGAGGTSWRAPSGLRLAGPGRAPLQKPLHFRAGHPTPRPLHPGSQPDGQASASRLRSKTRARASATALLPGWHPYISLGARAQSFITVTSTTLLKWIFCQTLTDKNGVRNLKLCKRLGMNSLVNHSRLWLMF